MDKQQGDRLFWIWLSQCLGEGSRWYPYLLERFITPFDIYKADEEELTELMPQMSGRLRQALCNKSLDKAYEILEFCRKGGCSLLCYGDAEYPLSLKALEDPPLVLYYRGVLPDFQNRLCVSVVGTRKMSEYGKRTAYKIAYEMAHAGAVIISGMALGIDSIAAGGALESGGQTVAVLGCGIDVAYPPQHATFKSTLEQRGAVITEYAPGARPLGFHFPMRNRIISGLSQATLVIDADERSGALITADLALSQGRAVYAVPANVGAPNSTGTNRLIRDGARVALCADDVLKDFSLLYRHSIDTAKTASLGAASNFNAEALARLGVRLSTVDEGPRPPSAPRRPTRKATGQTAAVQSEQPKQSVTPCPPDASAAALEGLSERERKVFEHIPMDAPVGIDRLQGLGYGTGELLTALSMLEICGLVQMLPGGLYARA